MEERFLVDQQNRFDFLANREKGFTFIDVEPARSFFAKPDAVLLHTLAYQSMHDIVSYYLSKRVSQLMFLPMYNSPVFLAYVNTFGLLRLTTLDGYNVYHPLMDNIRELFNPISIYLRNKYSSNYVQEDVLVLKVQFTPWNLFGIHNIHEDFYSLFSKTSMYNFSYTPHFISNNTIHFDVVSRMRMSESFKNFLRDFRNHGAETKRFYHPLLYQSYKREINKRYDNDVQLNTSFSTIIDDQSLSVKILEGVGVIKRKLKLTSKCDLLVSNLKIVLKQFNTQSDRFQIVPLDQGNSSSNIKQIFDDCGELINTIANDKSILGLYFAPVENVRGKKIIPGMYAITNSDHLILQTGKFYNMSLPHLHANNRIKEVYFETMDQNKILKRYESGEPLTKDEFINFMVKRSRIFQQDPFDYGL